MNKHSRASATQQRLFPFEVATQIVFVPFCLSRLIPLKWKSFNAKNYTLVCNDLFRQKYHFSFKTLISGPKRMACKSGGGESRNRTLRIRFLLPLFISGKKWIWCETGGAASFSQIEVSFLASFWRQRLNPRGR